MATLDRVLQMQSQGYSKEDIVKILREEGVSNQEILDAINQASVKTAIEGANQPPEIPIPETESPMPMQQSQMPPSQAPEAEIPEEPQGQGMQASKPQEAASPQGEPQSQPSPEEIAQEYYPQAPQAYDAQAYGQAYYPQEQQYPQEYYPQSAGYGYDTQLISEISEQIIDEKISSLSKTIEEIKEFKSETEEKISSLDRRLKRIEDAIDVLTNKIIGKVAEFGESNVLVHKDLESLHNTFSKMMDPLIDTYRELENQKKPSQSHKKTKKTRKKS